MSTLTAEQIQAMLGFVTNADETKSDKKSEFWLNVGVKVNHPETGEPMFINLPLFCPLDGLKPVKLTGTEKQKQFLAAKNALLEAFMKQIKSLGVSETRILESPFVIQISRTDIRPDGEKQAEASKDNPYMGQLGKLF